jgi:cardiolipin synthase
LYRRFLKWGVEIFEYEPQILHAKLMIVDDVVYMGSANLDERSLQINYELMIRFRSRKIAKQAREVFADELKYSRRMELAEWRKSRTLWQRVKQRLACLVLMRFDFYMARGQWRGMRD